MGKLLKYSVVFLMSCGTTPFDKDIQAQNSESLQSPASAEPVSSSMIPTVTQIPQADVPENTVKVQSPFTLVEEFTADTLANNEWKIGTELDYGVTDNLMLGTDLVALAVGVPSVQLKYYTYQNKIHHMALGMRFAYFNKKTFLWGDTKNHWENFSGRVFRPSFSWTQKLSGRLNIHTFWAKGLGNIDAELSELGRRKLCETKYPNANCADIAKNYNTQADDIGQDSGPDIGQDRDQDGKADDMDSDKNLERASSAASPFSQSIPVQSITGLAQDRFQITGEIKRKNGNKILVTARIEQTSLEELRANFFRLTVAHQWIWGAFQMKVGVGTHYYVMTGRDLDGVLVNDSGVQPASDIGFYWRF